MRYRSLLLATALLSLPFMVPAVQAEDDDPTFTEAYLKDRVNIDLGHKLFTQQCSKCHGKGAYPGKAPKLKPHKLTPEDVYLRITYGFRKMPPWEEVFSQEERMALTAYVKSDIFSN